MEYIKEFFTCDECKNKDFKRIYSFSMGFHGVNFSDELIYDKIIDEKYQCTNCQKIFPITDIQDELAEIKARHKNPEQE